MNPEIFGKIFDSEKIESWSDNYINYDGLIQDIIKLDEFLHKLINDNKKNEMLETKKMKKGLKNNDKKIIDTSNDNSKSNINLKKIRATPSLLSKLNDCDELFPNIKYNNEQTYEMEETRVSSISDDKQKENKKIIEDKIRAFIDSLDKELKKIYIFFSSKEKDIYQKINKKIQNKEQIASKQIEDIIKELDSINYIGELCKHIIIFIYMNIKALKNLLFFFDKSTKFIVDSLSYIYIKKFLSKNNSDLIYILNFQTLDETISTIYELFKEFEAVLNSRSDYKTDPEQKNKLKTMKNEIKNNINEYNKTHKQIFTELKEWQKYLNINLELPSSNHNSLFRNTSFIGDFVPNSKEIILINNKSFERELNNGINDSSSSINNWEIFSFDNKDKKILSDYKIELTKSLLNDENYTKNTFKESKILSLENKRNLYILYSLAFFYTYSYCIIISLLNNSDNSDNSDNITNYNYLYGLIVSLPLLGNLLSQIFILKIIKRNFKAGLLLSLLFILIHYTAIITCMVFNNSDNSLLPPISLCIGRIFLGLSSLKLLCKEYINIYIPTETQLKSNQNYLILTYLGYCFSFLLIGVQNFIVDDSPLIILIGISCLFLLILCIFSLISFKSPNFKDFRAFSNEYRGENRKNVITKNMALEQDEKEIVKEQDNYFKNANNISSLSGTNNLKNYSIKISEKRKKYLRKLFIILICVLISSQFTSENCLIFLSIINIGGDFNKDYKYGLFANSISYLICLLTQKTFLKIVSQKNKNKIVLIILSIISILILKVYIVIIYFCSIINDTKIDNVLFILNAIMIIMSDFYKIVSVNLFIKLIPLENLTFLCCKTSTFIMLTNKLIRLIPGNLIFFPILTNIQDTENNNLFLKFYILSIGFNIILFVISLISLCFFSRLEENSFTRILYYSDY